jgi:hypothetical protein
MVWAATISPRAGIVAGQQTENEFPVWSQKSVKTD